MSRSTRPVNFIQPDFASTTLRATAGGSQNYNTNILVHI